MSILFMQATFWLQAPDFICKDGHECSEEQACKQGDYQIVTHGYKTITLTLGLYCSKKTERSWCQSIIFIGGLFGELILPYFTDKWGRKLTSIIIYGVSGAFLFCANYASSFAQYLVANFLLGFFLWSYQTISYTIINESCNASFRQKASMGCLLMWSSAEIILTGVAYWLKDWREAYLFAITIPSCLTLIPLVLFLCETPMFSIVHHPEEKTIALLKHIARVNRQEIKEEELLECLRQLKSGGSSAEMEQSLSESCVTEKNGADEVRETQPQKGYYIWSLFQVKNLRWVTINTCICIASLQMVYFGSSYSLNSLDYSLYILVVVQGGVESLANVYSVLRLDTLKRKRMIFIFHSITVLICLLFLAVDKISAKSLHIVFLLILTGFLRCFNVLSQNLISIYIQEIYPTKIRITGAGFVYAMSVLGSFSAPFISEFALSISVYPIVILGTVASVGLISVYFFKETLNQPMKFSVSH